MTQGNATLTLDLGNSETRVILLYGKDANGKPREQSFRLSNRFDKVEEGYVLPTDYTEADSTVMRVDAVVNGVPLQGLYVNGEVQNKEYNIAPTRPSAIEKKYNAVTTAMSFELALLHAYKAIQSMTRASNINDLDITWNITALLPPGDVDTGQSKLIDVMKSIKYVDCTYPNVRIPIKLSRATILPEGFCAYIGTVYDRGRIVRPEMAYLNDEVVLIVDIGAGTTDFIIVANGKVINTSKFTSNRGGNQVLQRVRSYLRSEGIVLSETEIVEGVEKGFVKDGSKQKDISEILLKAKSEIAQQLVSDLQGYLEDTQYPIRSIGRLLGCGGGAMSSGNSGSLCDAIFKYIRTLAPNIERVEMPMHDVTVPDEDGVLHKEKQQISPRDLNVLGASIFAEMF